MTTSIRTLDLAGIGPAQVTIDEFGEGRPFLLLHGGGGPNTVTGFAELFATRQHVRVIAPTHPGFGGTARPDSLHTTGQLAALYIALLEHLDLTDVTLIGNSVGGWITAEMLLLSSPRVSGAVLVGAVGIDVPGHPVADFFSLTLDQVVQLSYHDPEKFRIDLSALPPAAQAIAAGNRAALAAYAGTSMTDPGLAQRLAAVHVPVLVLSGDSDQIVDPDYARAFAAAIPAARFQLLADTGHMPQIETPDQLLRAIWDFAGASPAPTP
jgi:pimeloyl-ACP methyl ester carboxylesterase